MNNKLKKGDNVMILSGKNKTKKGIIKKLIPKLNKVILYNRNRVKKHIKKKNKIIKGKLFEKEAYIHLSNIDLLSKY